MVSELCTQMGVKEKYCGTSLYDRCYKKTIIYETDDFDLFLYVFDFLCSGSRVERSWVRVPDGAAKDKISNFMVGLVEPC